MGFTFRILSQEGLVQKGCSEIDYPYKGAGLFVESYKKNIYEATDESKAYRVCMTLNEGCMTMAIYDTLAEAKKAVKDAREAYKDFVCWVVMKEGSVMPDPYYQLP